MIKAGEEFFSNYGPGYANILEKSLSPNKRWYHVSWKKFKEEHPNKIKLIENFETRNMEWLNNLNTFGTLTHPTKDIGSDLSNAYNMPQINQ